MHESGAQLLLGFCLIFSSYYTSVLSLLHLIDLLMAPSFTLQDFGKPEFTCPLPKPFYRTKLQTKPSEHLFLSVGAKSVQHPGSWTAPDLQRTVLFSVTKVPVQKAPKAQNCPILL